MLCLHKTVLWLCYQVEKFRTTEVRLENGTSQADWEAPLTLLSCLNGTLVSILIIITAPLSLELLQVCNFRLIVQFCCILLNGSWRYLLPTLAINQSLSPTLQSTHYITSFFILCSPFTKDSLLSLFKRIRH